ncbi:bifunctional DNA primase/polymerase [Cypionkella psychrotolerans]|uniref:bifunctional DNA primase/polymerase n=1 Tax=Cypionkella psychrotolerans TaxID=1678131 RepID=UPI0006B4B09F|nr:bifunctional DNA primase/polymerase [Cypionkella psychrotolerans]
MDQAGPKRDLPEHHGDADREAERRPEAMSAPSFAEVALKLLDQGYEPLPILPGQKRPAITGWTSIRIDEAQVEAWCRDFGHCSVGLRTGHLVGVDIDILDADLAHQAAAIVNARLGPALLRVGRWPKRLLLYRTETPFAKFKVGKVEVLAQGQQFVAFGIHPDTGRPYDWPMGESPLDVALHALPSVNEAMVEALLAELQPVAGAGPSGARRSGAAQGGDGQTRGVDGLVADGRDGWLSTIAFHAVQDSIDRSEDPDEVTLGKMVWARFAITTDMFRPRQNGRQAYGLPDALRKVRDKIRLHRVGRLPERSKVAVVPDYAPTSLDVDAARQELNRHLARAMAETEAWHRQGGLEAAPRIGVRATVGLGKSTAARHHVMELTRRLAADNLPHRILNLVPSLALADETAAAWRELGMNTAVLRGYEALHPTTRSPMCGDIPGIRAAIAAKVDIQSSVCFRSQSQQCRLYASCAKQANRREVLAAQVVVAAYDAMFTGFAGDKQDLGLIMIDEACWPRSFEADSGLTIEALPSLGIAGISGSRMQDAQGAALADVVAMRQKLSAALVWLTVGEVTGAALESFGFDAQICECAIISEYDALPAPHLRPGQSPADRKIALERSLRRALGLQVIGLWSALADLLGGETTAVAKVWLGGMGKDGQRPIRIWRRKPMAQELTLLPLLHLDATLRPELASTVLPGLDCVTVEAHAAHQHIRLISGNFGKGNLCPDPRQGAVENRRRASRLQECVDYVRWHAQRHTGGRILVITYLAIEAAFATIPGVETAHYNAVAGLDGWGDISALFLIGRPLPSSGDLGEMTGALFDRPVQGDYAARDVGLVLENGQVSGIRAIRHADASAEILRAAICDDEVMQALGRGRGVNRTADNPLEVHLMADVVLPVSYDRVQAWSIVCPDIVQRMLLAGIAVDSPGDAAKLHPSLFASPNAADCAFRREAFNRQNPIRDTYREMTVKSASYRLGGRGRSWQTAFWITGSADRARAQLERTIGPIVEWHCEP